jgi:hypothetical protein
MINFNNCRNNNNNGIGDERITFINFKKIKAQDFLNVSASLSQPRFGQVWG